MNGTLQGDIHALLVGDIIEIHEGLDAFLHYVRDRDVVDGSVAEVEQAVAGDDGAGGVEGLEEDQLVLGKLHVRPHLLVESIKGIVRAEMVDAVETLDASEAYLEGINHNRSLFYNSAFKGTNYFNTRVHGVANKVQID